MSKIEINNCVYKIHPVYDLYGADKDGNIINIIKKAPTKGRKNYHGYMMCCVRKHTQKGQKSILVHRFVWECHNGLIPEGKVIDHINDIRDDNRLSNLQLMTQKENVKKSIKKRDFSYVANNHKNRKCVRATNIETNEVTHFNSMHAVKQHLDINAGIVSMCCRGIDHHKSSVSKKDGQRYTFEYVKKEDMPDDYKKSANIRPKRVFDKWCEREYICPRCDKMMKNSNKYFHNKKCQ